MNDFTSKEIKTINIDEELSKLPGDIQVSLKDAVTQLNALPAQQSPELNTWKVTRLGKSPDKTEKDEMPIIADILAAGKRDFCVGFRGSSQGSAAYFFGLESDPHGVHIQSLLKAAFGLAQIAPIDDVKFNFERWGVCKRVILNEEQLNQLSKPSDNLASWVDSLAYTAFNKDCEIRLDFSPVNEKWIKEELDKTINLLDVLSKYQESNLQVSRSGGISINENGHAGKRILEYIIASRKENENENTSVSANLKQEHWSVSLACEELQFRIHELQQLRQDGGWCLNIHAKAEKSADLEMIKQIMGGFFVQAGYQCDWQKEENTGSGAILASHQIVRFVHHPEKFFFGLEMEPLRNFEVNLPHQDKPSLKAGYLIWNGQKMKDPDVIGFKEEDQPMVSIPLKDLNSHAFICGKSGSGKSNSVWGLLSRLDNIPFMVIEPVKGEYRSLKKIMPDLKIFNLEIHGENQLHMNPFWFPKKGKLSYHIDSLKSIIAASFELEAAMPNILEQCLVSSYVKKGWNISTNQNVFAGQLPDEMLYPTFTTLCNEVEQYLENAAFGAELKNNYKGALLSRLQSYTTGTKGMLLNCPAHPDFDEWIDNNVSCVIELDELADDSDKAIIMGTLLTQYFQCVKYGRSHGKPKLKRVIVLEEAHHLFKDVSASDNGGNGNRQHLVEILSNMLAEIRAYGEGLFIVDQSPTTISPQVIKNTAVKLVHYTDYVEDLKVLRECLLLDEADESAPASLETGHALLRFSSMLRPAHVHMPLCDTKEETGIHERDNCSDDDAQNILDMIRMNQTSREKLLHQSHMFINHFLFDLPYNKYTVLLGLIDSIASEAIGLGYDLETLLQVSKKGIVYILRNLIIESLPSKYPNQYLLCGRLQMVIERYVDLCLLQSTNITEHQSMLIEQYIKTVLHPSLAYYYVNSPSSELRIIAEKFPPSNKSMTCMSEIIFEMCQALKRDKLESHRKGEVYDVERIFSQPATDAVFGLCKGIFIQPLESDLAKVLLIILKEFWRVMESD